MTTSQRSVMASLVQGVSVMERDRQQNRGGAEARAPAWWKSFHFELVTVLTDAADESVFGAVYEQILPAESSSPGFVLALRGTMTKKASISRDLHLDFHVIKNGLENTSRFRQAMLALRGVLDTAYGQRRDVWLAGHSLGAAMATLAGKTMAKEGILLRTFLFNPPFLSAPIERIKDRRIKQGIRIANSLITAGVATVMRVHRNRSDGDYFAKLSSWQPYLCVNPADPISSEYAGYFEHRKKMKEIGAGGIGRVATMNTVKDLLLSAFGSESEPLHLLPSAALVVNRSSSPDLKTAHGIHQWWNPNIEMEIQYYTYQQT